MNGLIDTTDIPERRDRFRPVLRYESGRIPGRRLIRPAIVRELKRRETTPDRLWKEAPVDCPALSQSAVWTGR